MKEKDILKVIRSDIKNQTPNLVSKIDLSKITIISPSKEVVLPLKRTFQFKKIFSFAGLAAAVSVLIITLVVILGDNTIPNSPNKMTATDVYAFTAGSATVLVDNLDSVEISQQVLFSTRQGRPAFSPYITELNPYLNMIEDVIGKKNRIKTKIEENDTLHTKYQKKMTYQTRDLLNNEVTYYFIYNETVEVKQEKTKTYKTGIVLMGSKTYFYDSTETKKENNNKMETEVETTVYLKENDDKTYVRVEQEIENNELEFIYEIRKDGVTISESELEIEFDDGEIEIQLEIITRVNGNKDKVLYIIKKNDQENTYSIDYKLDVAVGNKTGNIFVTVSPDGSEYIYLIDKIIEVRKERFK